MTASKTGATPELSHRQRRFVELYCLRLEAASAAAEAGYSKRNAKRIGHQLLQKPYIAEAVRKRQHAMSEKTDLDEAWVLERLRRNVERCMQAEPVLDREGNETGEYKFDASGANRALELIGRHLAMFTDRIRVDPVEELTDDELNDRITDKLNALGTARAAPTAH